MDNSGIFQKIHSYEYENQADELFKSAKKLVDETNIIKKTRYSEFKINSQYNEARELYVSAASRYKLGDCLEKLINAFDNAGKVTRDKLGYNMSAAKYFEDAGIYCTKIDTYRAIEFYRNALSCYCLAGNNSSASDCCVEIAKILLSDSDEPQQAIPHYENAIRLLEGKELPFKVNEYKFGIAEIRIKLDEFSVASKILENLTIECVKNRQFHHALPYFIRAVLCEFCFDLDDGTKMLSILTSENPILKDSDEFTFLDSISRVLEKPSTIDFNKAVEESKKIIWINNENKKLLEIIGRKIKEEHEL